VRVLEAGGMTAHVRNLPDLNVRQAEHAWKRQRKQLDQAVAAMGQHRLTPDGRDGEVRRLIFDAIEESRRIGRSLGFEY
jgi:hypothetical protein